VVGVPVIHLARLPFRSRRVAPPPAPQPEPRPWPLALLNAEAEIVQSNAPTALHVSGAEPGALPAPADARRDQLWWTTRYGHWRLAKEIEAMRRFPGFTLSLEVYVNWRGWLETALSRSRYRVRVAYPERFPAEAPWVCIEEPEIPPGVPHQLGPGRPCLYRPLNDPRYGYAPGRTTAATLVAWTALWLHAYETWRVTGAWPGQED
jgi:hypothetical protein